MIDKTKAVKVFDRILAAYFIAVAFLMYYFITEQISFGSLCFTYRHLFAILIIVSGFVVFLIRPDIHRTAVSFKGAAVLSVPLFVEIAASLLIWILNHSSTAVIRRGISQTLIYMNWFSFALAAGIMLMVFGEMGIWYNLAALLASNLLMILQIMLQYGIVPFITEYITLVVTFADTTGEVVGHAEIHELAFCLGAYLLYMICRPKKKIWFWVMFALGAFCFTAAMKRIAVLAIIAAVGIRVVFWFVQKRFPKYVNRTVNIVMLFAMVILIVYIYVVHSDIFAFLQSHGIETSGRSGIYEAVSKYYDFSPSFIGNGIGFLTYQLNEVVSIGVSAVHNDFLQMFIDLGFWGYLFWLASMTILRSLYFGRNHYAEGAVIASVVTVYLLICSATDNTVNYPLLTTTTSILMMGNHYDEEVEEHKIKFRKNTFAI